MDASKFDDYGDDQITELYVKLRDLKKQCDDEYKEKMKPTIEAMDAIENNMHGRMNERGSTSIKCNTGTTYLATTVSSKVVDWEETLNYIKQEGMWGLLEARVSKKGVQAVLEDTGVAVPGVQTRTDQVVRFRRPTKKV